MALVSIEEVSIKTLQIGKSAIVNMCRNRRDIWRDDLPIHGTLH
jgi:hypothetical protein